ncbi:hypothetical protein BC827DRAFT_807833 [Russula dissimulans]|nr:hypothetical protein BC827DRAFT_807833 [Russula dissimulans]
MSMHVVCALVVLSGTLITGTSWLPQGHRDRLDWQPNTRFGFARGLSGIPFRTRTRNANDSKLARNAHRFPNSSTPEARAALGQRLSRALGAGLSSDARATLQTSLLDERTSVTSPARPGDHRVLSKQVVVCMCAHHPFTIWITDRELGAVAGR